MVLVAYAGPVCPAAVLRDSVLCLPTDIHSLFVNKPSSSSTFLLLLLLLSGSATRQRVVPTDRHSFVVCQ